MVGRDSEKRDREQYQSFAIIVPFGDARRSGADGSDAGEMVLAVVIVEVRLPVVSVTIRVVSTVVVSSGSGLSAFSIRSKPCHPPAAQQK